MHIDKNTLIYGKPALQVRRFFRQIMDFGCNLDILKDSFGLSQKEAEQMIVNLFKDGYIEKGNKDCWKATIKGRALAIAPATKQIHRNTADKRIQELLNRIELVNKKDHYLLKVEIAYVFGSYLSNKDRISDIDIAIDLQPKEKNDDKYFTLCQQRRADVAAKGKRFRNLTEELCWPIIEVHQFLKSHSRSLSIHGIVDLKVAGECKKVIYDVNKPKGESKVKCEYL